MAYVTLAQLKQYLGIVSTADDVLLSDLSARAQKIVESRTGRKFEAAADATRYFTVGQDTRGSDLILDDDLCAITSITNGDGVLVAVTEYMTMPRHETPYYAIRLKGAGGKYWDLKDGYPEDAITVVGRWAYSTTPPADIVHATLRVAAWLYRQKDAQVFEPTAMPGLGQMYIAPRFPSDIAELFDTYLRTC